MTALAPDTAQRRRWHPAPLLTISLVLHAAAAALFAIHPAAWPWLLAAIAANHAVIIASAFCPRGQLLGANVVRLPAAAAERGEVALTFDDGPDPEVTPRVLDLLDRYQMKASFFCVGRRVCAHPAMVEEIVRRGHSVENHTFGHIHWFAAVGPWRMAREIEAAQSAIARIAGRAPRFFRAPNGFRNPFLDPLLAARGLTYVAWTRRGLDTVRRDARAVTRALLRNLAAGDVLLLHDRGSARTASGEALVLAVLPAVLERMKALGLKSVPLAAALETRT